MIYVLGTGYIAQAYARYFIINSIPYRLISRKEVLYTNPITLAGFLNTAKPELLINAAGFVTPSVSTHEEHKLASIYSNGVFPGFIGELCQSMNIPWIHVSSGDVFTPSDTHAYTENDKPNNTKDYYNNSKIIGEDLLEKYNTAYICRFRRIFNNKDHPKNYITQASKQSFAFTEIGSITNIDDGVKASIKLWDNKAPTGTYNIVNTGIVDVRELMSMLVKYKLRVDIPSITSYGKLMLDNSKINSIIPMIDVNESLQNCIKNWNP